MKDYLTRHLHRIVSAVMVMGVLLAGCDSMKATPVSEINKSAASFDGKEVTLRGVAAAPTRLPILNLKSYVLRDDSGEITIRTQADLPHAGQDLEVRVKVENIAIIEGEPLGTTITEIRRH